MRELKLVNGKIIIPEEFDITKTKRKLKITTPYSKRFDILLKDDFRIQTTQYFRQKDKQKPYIPDGFVEIDGERFKVIEEKANG